MPSEPDSPTPIPPDNTGPPGNLIPPDDKDWTWVLTRPCPECGFDAAATGRESVADLLRSNAATWADLLAHPLARARPSPDRWSALEYGCHVRDVFTIYDGRLVRMLDEDDPLYPNWDQNVTAIEEGYAEQDPASVIEQLDAAAARLADRFDTVRDAQWQRSGRRSDGAHFTVESFGRYMIHDPIHHVHDVTEGLNRLAPGG